MDIEDSKSRVQFETVMRTIESPVDTQMTDMRLDTQI